MSLQTLKRADIYLAHQLQFRSANSDQNDAEDDDR